MSNLKSLVEIERRFQRSVSINASLFSSEHSLEGYQLLPSCVSVLNTISEHVLRTNQRAFTITGAFGTGKSALGFYICCLSSPQEEIKERALSKLRDYSEYQDIKKVFSDKTYDVHVLVGKRGSIADDLNNELFGSRASSLSENIKDFNQSSEKNKLVIVDELGRYLSQDQFDNCAALQNLAEAINCEGSKIIFIGILHQNFTAYAQFSAEYQKLEWQKVQGRFLDTPLVSHSEETLRMLSSALKTISPNKGNREYSDKSIEITVNYLASLRKTDREKLTKTFQKTWPLNPIVSLLLGPLSKRGFWQNNRSVFNFLTSLEPFGFQDFLASTNEHSPSLYGPTELWTYLEANYGLIIASDPTERRNWSVALDCIGRTEALDDPNSTKVIKTIALLFLFSAGSPLRSNFQVIRASLPELQDEEILRILSILKMKKIIVEKRHADYFSLFEGSDFDFDESYEKLSIAEISPSAVNQLLNLPTVVARRNYIETGCLRWFQCRIADKESLQRELKVDSKGAIGKLILWLGTDSEQELKELCSNIEEYKNGVNLVGIPSNRKEILSMSVELQKINRMLQDPALEGDRIARLEVQSTYNTAEDRLNSLIGKAFQDARWLIDGTLFETIENSTALNKLLSDLCDQKYNFSLRLNNELVNRDELSPNIKRARKNLIQHMLTREGSENLGFEGMPPEAMIFLSLFEAKGAYVQTETGFYNFCLPENNSSLIELWKLTKEYLSGKAPVELTALYELWAKEPFGIKKGLMPILLVFFYCLNKKTLTFYLEKTYQAEVSPELIDLILARPELIQLKNYSGGQRDSEITDALFDYLRKEDETLVENSPLSVARSLVRKVFLQPKWALSTARASSQSKRFCEEVLKASDPIDLLFDQLPAILGAGTAKEVEEKIIERFNELEELSSSLYREVKEYLLKELDTLSEAEIEQRGAAIKGHSGDFRLEGFIGIVSSLNKTNIHGIESLLSFVTGKQKGRWSDFDLLKAKTAIAELSFKFRHLEALSSSENLNNSRKLLGIVSAGDSGRKEWVIDVSSTPSPKSVELASKIGKLLEGLSREETLSVLIDTINQVEGEK
ncbi:hypothetical protein [Parasutterella excrementihominis]|uniref:hypothetical protein n=1 Tax=Parasutterella excrementihominis TaxID=487175 RepID=UPI0026669319|nr:hypothetical protein [Parasutterella excrementihominis]